MHSRIRAGFALLMLALASVAVGAAAGERLKDYVIIGLGTSADKVLEFDAGAGSSNARVLGTSSGQLGLSAGGATRETVASGGITATVPRLGAAGTAGAPSYSFALDADTGAYNSAANGLGLAAGGALRAEINSTSVTATVPFLGANGAAATPTFSFSGDLDTGVYHFATNELGFSAGGTRQMEMRAGYVRTQVPHAFVDGSAASPGITFEDDQDVGFYRITTNSMGLTLAGTQRIDFSPNAFVFKASGSEDFRISTAQAQAIDGSSGTPSYSFGNDADTGLFRLASNQIGITTGGATRAAIDSGGLQFLESGAGQGSIKWKTFTGTIAASGTTDLTIPGTLMFGAVGASSKDGDTTNMHPMMRDDNASAGANEFIYFRSSFAGGGAGTDVRLSNLDNNSTNTYRVIMYYQ